MELAGRERIMADKIIYKTLPPFPNLYKLKNSENRGRLFYRPLSIEREKIVRFEICECNQRVGCLPAVGLLLRCYTYRFLTHVNQNKTAGPFTLFIYKCTVTNFKE